MCGGTSPEYRLAQILTRHFGMEISPSRARSLIRDHWSKISVLAHEIHDELSSIERRNDILEDAAKALDGFDYRIASKIRELKA